MKKIKIGAMLCAVLLLLSSCDQNSETSETTDTTGTEYLNAESSTVYPPAVIPSDTSAWLNETTESSVYIPPAVIPSDYMNEFESFGEFPVDRNTTSLYYDKSKVEPNHLKGSGAIRVVVEGINRLEGEFTVYDVRILECYGFGENVDTEHIYQMGYRGTPKNPLHDRPALQIGKEYIRPGKIKLETQLMQAAVMMPVEYINGTAYIYGYGVDFSQLSCAIEITNEAENQILKPGIHDKYIEYAEANDIIFPTFDYKCELYAFLREIGILRE